jgi:hypothetical protein
MDLKDFIAETLEQIQAGVQEAIRRRSSTPDASGAINPVWGNAESICENDIEKVEFDVAVTVADKTAGGLKGGVKVLGIEIAGEGSKDAEHSTVSRIKFAVRIVPPVQLVVRPATGKILSEHNPFD